MLMLRVIMVTQCADRDLHALVAIVLILLVGESVNNSLSSSAIIFMVNAYLEEPLETQVSVFFQRKISRGYVQVVCSWGILVRQNLITKGIALPKR